MRIFLLIITASFLFVVFYIHFSSENYINKQATDICQWLYGASTNKPEVGPQAFEHLVALKKSSDQFSCQVVTLAKQQGYHYEMVIEVKSTSQGNLHLIYGLAISGRHFLRPRYRQHSSSQFHSHS